MGSKSDRLVELTTLVLLAIGGVLADAGFHMRSSKGWFFTSWLVFGLAVFIPLSYFLIHPIFTRLAVARATYLVQQDEKRSMLPKRVRPRVRGRWFHIAVSDEPPEGLVVTGAFYGPIDGSAGGEDRTVIVSSKVINGRLNFTVSNTELGGDPVEGRRKHLILNWRNNGMSFRNIIEEGGEVHLP